jgi:hypothetical protein
MNQPEDILTYIYRVVTRLCDLVEADRRAVAPTQCWIDEHAEALEELKACVEDYDKACG